MGVHNFNIALESLSKWMIFSPTVCALAESFLTKSKFLTG